MSDGGVGIGSSMLQCFVFGSVDEEGDDSDHESSSRSESGRTSLKEVVDGFPEPFNRDTSFILDVCRQISTRIARM
jgi:hypothetical protein